MKTMLIRFMLINSLLSVNLFSDPIDVDNSIEILHRMVRVIDVTQDSTQDLISSADQYSKCSAIGQVEFVAGILSNLQDVLDPDSPQEEQLVDYSNYLVQLVLNGESINACLNNGCNYCQDASAPFTCKPPEQSC